ncbi:MAG: hypothetical protein HY659_06360, partial [Rhizobiales bacterium]|nr:hypothetical protein [Hyphomicrobiales bacterium]
PILFGSIVIVLGELVIWSYYWRTPLLLVLIIVSVVALFRADRFHDVQFVGGPNSKGIATGAAAQIGFEEAVARWKVVNCKPDCPRPILIAGAGGASRAAYLTATVVGALFDRGPDIRNRVFAMSTVSGSSVGAVVMRAALADAAESENPNRPPCKSDTDQLAWFGDLKDGTRFRTKPDVTTSWLDCFQKLLAGDFLSPVIVGLAYRDNFPIQNPVNHQPLWPDRAVLLEESFERRYSSVTTRQAKRCADAGKDDDDKGLCRRFGFHPHPRDVKNAWLPLLFINGTSVATGRRIIAADVPIGKSYKDKQLLLPFAYDVNEIRNWRPKRNANDKPHDDKIEFCRMPAVTQGSDAAPSADVPGKTIDNCFRLSTASTLSARFPVISPQGNLRDRSADVRDKVVDGGYFENDAMATLADVAWALKATYGLHPVAIRIVNDPVPREGKEDSLGGGRPSLANEDERAFFDDVLSIVRTLTATRSGHEDGHRAYLEGALTVGPDKEEPAVADGKKKFTGAHGEDRLYEVHVYELKAASEPAPEGTPVAKQRQVAQKPVQQFRLCRRNIDQAKIGKTAYMETVSMSWWMSHPVQAYLDAQLCVEANWNRLECELQEGRIAPGGTCR